ncbi:MAG: helix-hairpin-helix domain-containing protein, partial [Halobacteriaceae archaeon]
MNPDKVANRPLNIYFYDILQTSATIESQRDIFDLLDHLGIRINQYNQFVDDIDSFIEYRENMLEKRDEMSQTARHPRWAFAYKFPAQTGETTIEQIVVQVGRTGKLTPVALLQPVDIKGVTISRATLHNESQAQQLGVGEGARVSIERAGDVIPEVAEVLESGDDVFEMPETCPVCDSQVVQEGEYHYCTGGMSCKAQLKRSVQHYASQGALDIEGIGEKVADELVEKGFIDSIADIYTLDVDDLSDLEGWGEQSASNLVEEIEASKSPTLTEFIFGLGIRHTGKERARLLAEDFTLDELRNADIEDL